MKRLIGMLLIVVALCTALAVPASAAKPVEVSGMAIWDWCEVVEQRPIGKGEDDHYCLNTVDCQVRLVGDVAGTMILHYEILKKGTCGSGPAAAPSVQRAWGPFTGDMWDGEQMRSGTCKSTWHGGWDWEEGVLVYRGRLTLHAYTGGLAGAHANLELGPVGEIEDVYSGRAFFGGKP